jgi:dTDP-glucose pyrophosphorylase
MHDLRMVIHAHHSTVAECLTAIQDGGSSIALAVDDDERLVGIVTDGDVRRGWLSGAMLSDPVSRLLQDVPLTVRTTESRAAVRDLMQARGINQVPVLDDTGRLCGIHLLREFLGPLKRSNIALILAGGRGSRLGPLTQDTPKPMMEVAGRPILERLVDHLVGHGIALIYLSVGYRADAIISHFGDGSRFGCAVQYLIEDPARPLGTGGPLASLWAEAAPENPILVVNGDLVTQFDASGMLGQHESTEAEITIGVFPFSYEIPFGVVELDRGAARVTGLHEKPTRFETVSAGIYVVSPGALGGIPKDEFVPMTQVISELLTKGARITTWDCGRDWVDVGQPRDLARARGM